jgi:hypothetical protein
MNKLVMTMLNLRANLVPLPLTCLTCVFRKVHVRITVTSLSSSEKMVFVSYKQSCQFVRCHLTICICAFLHFVHRPCINIFLNKICFPISLLQLFVLINVPS